MREVGRRTSCGSREVKSAATAYGEESWTYAWRLKIEQQRLVGLCTAAESDEATSERTRGGRMRAEMESGGGDLPVAKERRASCRKAWERRAEFILCLLCRAEETRSGKLGDASERIGAIQLGFRIPPSGDALSPEQLPST